LAERVERKAGMRNVHTRLVGDQKRRNHMRDLDVDGRTRLKDGLK